MLALWNLSMPNVAALARALAPFAPARAQISVERIVKVLGMPSDPAEERRASGPPPLPPPMPLERAAPPAPITPFRVPNASAPPTTAIDVLAHLVHEREQPVLRRLDADDDRQHELLHHGRQRLVHDPPARPAERRGRGYGGARGGAARVLTWDAPTVGRLVPAVAAR